MKAQSENQVKIESTTSAITMYRRYHEFNAMFVVPEWDDKQGAFVGKQYGPVCYESSTESDTLARDAAKKCGLGAMKGAKVLHNNMGTWKYTCTVESFLAHAHVMSEKESRSGMVTLTVGNIAVDVYRSQWVESDLRFGTLKFDTFTYEGNASDARVQCRLHGIALQRGDIVKTNAAPGGKTYGLTIEEFKAICTRERVLDEIAEETDAE